ncbi:MAG: hypothetical protein UGF45_04935 [Massilioclostridium sp.]|nr:hypothetical protein [Massilioclostridium sp.]MEE1491364.1 hypothetical protein [Massilioclostridium sp.]
MGIKRRNCKRRNPCICAIGIGVFLLMIAFTPLRTLLIIAAVALIVIGVMMLFSC